MDDLLGSLFGAHGRGRRPARGADIRTTLTINPLLAFTGGKTTFQMQSGSGGSAQTVKLTVPAGVKTGTTLRLAGKGSPPPGGGPAGDLHIRLTVPSHPLIRRIDNDLELDVPVTVLEALEGAHVTVPTPTGDVKVRIPPGSQTGRKLRLRGRGVQTKTPGDLYLVIRPTIPISDDPEVLEAARSLANAHTTGVRDGLKL